ncbi:DUF6541 family protein [Microbacterium sp.]|uniref:DUF6541 family protein n=1 Tax=Microbacterium sp. TaxID=51671 RepID=UPI003242EACB
MTWFALAVATAAAVAIVFLPGLVLTLAAGLRGLWALALAAPVGASVIGLAALVAPMVGLGWSLATVGLFTLAAAIVVFGLRLFLWRSVARPATRARASVVALAVAIAAGICAVQLIIVIGDPENISQTFDNIFHLNAVRYILDNGNASPLFVASMTSAGAPPGFYPTGWHAVSSLVVQVAGVTIPIASHATMLTFAALSWPIGIVLLARTFGLSSTPALIAAGVAAASFPAFPLLPVDYGVLFPYMMGVSLVPATLAALVAVTSSATVREGSFWIAVVLATVPGIAIAHPGALMALVLFGAIIVLHRVVHYLRSGPSRRAKVATVAAIAVGLAVFCGLWYAVRPEASARTWLHDETVAQAIGEIVAASPARSALNIVMASLIGVGVLVCLRRRSRHDLVMLTIAAAAAALYIVVSGLPYWTVRDMVVGVWYDNSPRLAALLPIMWVPLAGTGFEAAWRWAARRLRQRGTDDVVVVRLLVGAAVLVFVVPQATVSRVAVAAAAESYRFSPDAPLLSADERDLLEELPSLVPADAVVAGSPWTGTALAYAIANRRVLMPHTLTATTSDANLINDDLGEATPGSAVCNAVNRENVRYVLDFGTREVNDGHHPFPGMLDLRDSAAVELVTAVGDARLYRVVGCD